MRTDAEIIARINERKNYDPLGFETNDLLSFLSVDAIRPFLKEGVDLPEFVKLQRLPTTASAGEWARITKYLSAPRAPERTK